MKNVQPGTSNVTDNITEQPIPFKAIKDSPNDERLTAAEMGHLWELYLYNAASKCLLQYFGAKAQDPEISGVLDYALQIMNTRLNKISQIFNTVGFPIPQAFNDEDVEPNARRLYSDGFMLVYIQGLINFELAESMIGLNRAVRVDIKEYYQACIDQSQDLFNRASETLVRKGLWFKPPNIPVPDRVEYVHQETFFAGLLGDKRPMNALEIFHVYTRLQTKMVERALILGFSQVVQSEKVLAFLSKGKQLIDKQIEGWSKILEDEGLPLPVTWEHEITNSTESPFSDKLIMFTILTMMRNSVTMLGISIANTVRADIVTAFAGTIAELQAYSRDALDLAISSGWLEKVPSTADRREIINQSHQNH